MNGGRKRAALAAWLLCAAVLAGGLSACSRSSGSAPQKNAVPAVQEGARTQEQTAAGGDAAVQADSAQQDSSKGTALAAAQASSGQKIIEKLSYRIETLKFDESVRKIGALSTDLGGYVQESNVAGKSIQGGGLRSASFVLRIPQEKLGGFKDSAAEIGNVLSFSGTSENVGETYFDTEARLRSLRTQQERLLALLQKSGAMADIISLEKALSDVNYQIEQLTGTLRQYDSLISFSTVSVELQEVVKPTEQEDAAITLGDRMLRALRRSLRGLGSFGEGLLVFLVGGAPILLLLALIALVVFRVVRRKRKRRETQREALPVQKPPDGGSGET